MVYVKLYNLEFHVLGLGCLCVMIHCIAFGNNANRPSEHGFDIDFRSYLAFFNSERLGHIRKGLSSMNTHNWIQSLDRQIFGNRFKRQSRTLPIRKEIRMLTEEERMRFFNALNALKNDTSLSPNVYDAIAAYHRNPNIIRRGHGGSAFLGFHRIYCLRLEYALRQKDPRVTLPYWDSTIDAELDDPALSILWTPAYFGNGFNEVNMGPFANWTGFNGSPITRNIGFVGNLIQHNVMENMIRDARNHSDVIQNVAGQNRLFPRTIEGLHNSVHSWVGGTMSGLQTAAEDPVFFLHHCFIDLMWERVRQRIRETGGNPETDYPATIDGHEANNEMAGFSFLRNFHGYSDRFTRSFYNFEPQPTCNRTMRLCPATNLTCTRSRFQRETFVCASRTSNYVLDVSPEVRYSSALKDMQTDIGPRFTSEDVNMESGLIKLMSQSGIPDERVRDLLITVLSSPENMKSFSPELQRRIINRLLSAGMNAMSVKSRVK